MLRQSLEKMRLLSASLGPLTCRTLDHLLCPAGTAAVRCSACNRGAGWEPLGAPRRIPGAREARALKPGLAALPRAITNHTAIDMLISSQAGPDPAAPGTLNPETEVVPASGPSPKCVPDARLHRSGLGSTSTLFRRLPRPAQRPSDPRVWVLRSLGVAPGASSCIS